MVTFWGCEQHPHRIFLLGVDAFNQNAVPQFDILPQLVLLEKMDDVNLLILPNHVVGHQQDHELLESVRIPIFAKRFDGLRNQDIDASSFFFTDFEPIVQTIKL